MQSINQFIQLPRGGGGGGGGGEEGGEGADGGLSLDDPSWPRPERRCAERAAEEEEEEDCEVVVVVVVGEGVTARRAVGPEEGGLEMEARNDLTTLLLRIRLSQKKECAARGGREGVEEGDEGWIDVCFILHVRLGLDFLIWHGWGRVVSSHFSLFQDG